MSDVNTSTKLVTFQLPKNAGELAEFITEVMQGSLAPDRVNLFEPRFDLDLVGPSTMRKGATRFYTMMSVCGGPFKNVGELHFPLEVLEDTNKFMLLASEMISDVKKHFKKITTEMIRGVLSHHAVECSEQGIDELTSPTRDDAERLLTELATMNHLKNFDTENFDFMIDQVIDAHNEIAAETRKAIEKFEGALEGITSSRGKGMFGRKKKDPVADMAEALMKEMDN